MFVAQALRVHLPVLAVAALLVSGCGSEGSSVATAGHDSSSASPSKSESAPPGTPDCTSVWQAGATLPRSYSGCVDDADFVPRDALGCSSGQRIVRYADRYYAVPGGTVHAATKPLDHDRQYLAVIRRCRA